MKKSTASCPDSGSLKWIYAAKGSTTLKPQISVNEAVRAEVFGPVARERCNLISIFGAARQGKSFLMNCLAGTTGLFTISNLSTPCTQGIDISRNMVSLKAFSEVDGGRSVSSRIKVGFVDAEGQGDRDVTYDANLVCPILLASKCVILNWMDSVQKDKILNHLGIMQKAALNVAEEGDVGEEGASVFGHLHLVFRDWRFQGDEKSVMDDIFKPERGADTATAVRNQIRMSIKQSFQSVSIWLFPPPAENTQSLRTEMTVQGASTAFRNKLREFRAALAGQMQDPMIFNSRPLTGGHLGTLVQTVVQVLNTGHTVSPMPAWIAMSVSEVDAIRLKCEKWLREDLAQKETELVALAKNCDCIGATYQSRRQMQVNLEASLTAFQTRYAEEVEDTVGRLEGDLAEQVLNVSQQAVQRIVDDSRSKHEAKYAELLQQWLRQLIDVTLSAVESALASEIRLPITDSDELEHQLVSICESLEQKSSLRTAKEDYGVQDEVMRDYQRQLNTFTELQFDTYRRENAALLDRVTGVVHAAVEKSVQNIQAEVDNAVVELKSKLHRPDQAVAISPYSQALDKKYFSEKKILTATITADVRSALRGSTAGVDMEGLITNAVKRLEDACMDMGQVLKSQHEAVARASVADVAKGCVDIVSADAMTLLEEQSSCTEASLREQFADLVQEATEAGREQLNGWGVVPEELAANLDAIVQSHCASVLKTLLISHQKVAEIHSKMTAETDRKKEESDRQAVESNKKLASRPVSVAAPGASKKRRVTAVMDDLPQRVPMSVIEDNDRMEECADGAMSGTMSDEDTSSRTTKKTRRASRKSSTSPAATETAKALSTNGDVEPSRQLSIAEQRKRAKQWHQEQKKVKERTTLSQLEEENQDGTEDEDSNPVDAVAAAKATARSKVQQRAQARSSEAFAGSDNKSGATTAKRADAAAKGKRRGK